MVADESDENATTNADIGNNTDHRSNSRSYEHNHRRTGCFNYRHYYFHKRY
jgi:hypothetical protein